MSVRNIFVNLASQVFGLLGLAKGGTNADLSATGGASQVLRQSSGGAAVTVSQLAASDLSNGVTGSGAVVLATSPTITTPTTVGSISVPQPLGSAVFSLSSTATGQTVTNSGGTITPFANANNFSGLFIVNDTTNTGECAVFLTAGGGMILIAQTGTSFTKIQGTVLSINVYLVGNAVTIENKKPGDINVSIISFRTRASQ